MKESHLPAIKELRDLASMSASKSGIDFQTLTEQCAELVVFGSQAAGLQTQVSDLDVLAVGADGVVPKLARGSHIDLVFRTVEDLQSPEWLNSELAGHIAVYGRWLQGVGDWRERVLDSLGRSNDAAEAKLRRVDRLVCGLRKHWDRLTPDFRRRNLLTLRREKQRYALLHSGLAVPPTRLLDAWAEREALSQGVGLDELLSHEFKGTAAGISVPTKCHRATWAG